MEYIAWWVLGIFIAAVAVAAYQIGHWIGYCARADEERMKK